MCAVLCCAVLYMYILRVAASASAYATALLHFRVVAAAGASRSPRRAASPAAREAAAAGVINLRAFRGFRRSLEASATCGFSGGARNAQSGDGALCSLRFTCARRDATPRDPRVSGVRTRVYCAARAAPLIKARAAEHSRCLLSVRVSLIQNVRDATHCLQSPQLPVALRYYMYPCVVLWRSRRSLLSLFRGVLRVASERTL